MFEKKLIIVLIHPPELKKNHQNIDIKTKTIFTSDQTMLSLINVYPYQNKTFQENRKYFSNTNANSDIKMPKH